ncbi:uroporphyrinogen-III C-methyltransferase [Candidatus Enterovibrio escicola]|uniref:uroporphyrinogen-III C-methyltransferase n=1 Tax=Candidatus Enterovibrio escicola TaxID=1927127 RepID=UPI001237C890|nr:uroporphyrinogen-III C-methyltransferase [Candidatus Enterovibrio escacola]
MTDNNKTSSRNKGISRLANPSAEETETSFDKDANSQSSNGKPVTTSSPNNNKNQYSTTAKSTSSSPTAEQSTQEEKYQGNKLSMVAIALTIALGGSFYYHYHLKTTQYNTDISVLTLKIDALKRTLSKSTKQNHVEVKNISQKTLTLIKQQDKTIQNLQSAMTNMKTRHPNDWILAEAEYLVNQAGRHLWLVHDVLTATTLMETADLRIAELNDPSMTLIRQTISQDIMKLKAIERIDRDGIVLCLNNLQQEVDKLPLANAFIPEIDVTIPMKVSSNIDDWKQNIKISLSAFLGQFITYRKRESDVVPLLTLSQTFYLQENLKAKLDRAITAVYRENGHIYTESIRIAKAWVERFYNKDAKSTKAFITTLTHLSDQTIEVNYPEILYSQNMISNILADRLRHKPTLLPNETFSNEAISSTEITQ